MKKKLLGLVLVATLAASLMACGGEKVITGDNSSAAGQQTEATSGYTMVINGTTVAIGAEASGVIAGLGEPMDKYEAPSCAFGDLDITYTYGGFQLTSYQENGVDYISGIILQDDSLTTPEGLTIGDAASKVTELYGAATTETETQKVYNKGDMKLIVILNGDTVASIQYMNTMLD